MKNVYIFTIALFSHFCLSAQTTPAYVDTNSLLIWYPFNGNANNEYGTGINGSVMGATITTDRFGNANSAYHFDGQLDHIAIDSAFFNVGWSNYTISFWMKNDSLDNPFNFNNDQSPFSSIPHYGLAMLYNWGHNDKYQMIAGSVPGSGSWDILGAPLSTDTITSHIWNHLVMVKQNDTIYRFYLNGVLDSRVVSPILAESYYIRLVLGNIDSTIGNEGVWGDLDDYGIWKRALSDCEIKRLYNSSPYLFLTSQPVNVLTDTTTAEIPANAHFSITDTGIGNTYQWQVNTGSGFIDISSATPYSGVTTATLTITGITNVMNGNLYRCIVTGIGGCSDSSAYAKLSTPSLGVSNISGKISYSISPNPTNGNIVINGSKPPAAIRIYNIEGQMVKQATDATKISISEMPAGMYLVKLFDGNGMLVYYDKVIKQ